MTFQFEKSGKLKPLTAEELVEADKGPPIIVRDRGISSDGRPYWLYLAIRPSKYKDFQRATKAKQPITFTDYGEILRYGYAEEIPENIKEEMKQKYGCDDNFMANVEKKLEQERSTFLKVEKEKEDKRIDDIVAMLKNKS